MNLSRNRFCLICTKPLVSDSHLIGFIFLTLWKTLLLSNLSVFHNFFPRNLLICLLFNLPKIYPKEIPTKTRTASIKKRNSNYHNHKHEIKKASHNLFANPRLFTAQSQGLLFIWTDKRALQSLIYIWIGRFIALK